MSASAKGTTKPFTVGTTPVNVSAGVTLGRSILIYNNSTTATIYTGYDNTVSASNGMPIMPGGGESFEDYVGPLWVVSSAAATDVRVQGVGG